jgi:hypothetical protein
MLKRFSKSRADAEPGTQSLARLPANAIMPATLRRKGQSSLSAPRERKHNHHLSRGLVSGHRAARFRVLSVSRDCHEARSFCLVRRNFQIRWQGTNWRVGQTFQRHPTGGQAVQNAEQAFRLE